MNSIASWCLAIGLGAITAIHPQVSAAEGFTGKQFLEQGIDEQRGYVSTQLVMASSIAARIKPPLAECISEQFFNDAGMSEPGFNGIVTRISEFDEYHPSSVIVIVIESTCGSFN